MTLAFWSTAILLLAGALLFVLPPLLRPRTATQAGPSPLAVYREQRVQLDAELAQGRLSAAQHARALEELQGRVLDEVGEDCTSAPQERRTPFASVVAVALLLPAGALAVYAVLGKPAALGPSAQETAAAGTAPHTMSREQMEEMVERLAEKLKATPDDADGWHMLARSYVAFGRLAEAAQAYDRASTLAPRDPQVLADYADTLAMVNGRKLEGRPAELVNAALKIAPDHPKSLSLAGTAAFNRGDYAAAIAYWRRLQALLPAGSPQAQGLGASIAEAQAKAGGAPATVTAPVTEGAIEGSVAVSDALKARLAPGATLFVFARVVEGPRIPLAIVKVPAGSWPHRFQLDDASAMAPQFRLSGQSEVMLGARISASGNATPQTGDLMGSIGPVKVGTRGVRIVIDEVVR